MLSVGAAIKSEIESKDRQKFSEKTILSIITAYEKIEALFTQVTQNTTPFKHVPEVRDWLTSSIRLIIQGKFEGLSQADRLGVIRELEEYQRKTGRISDDDGISEFAEALLFPHPDNPVYWDHGNPATLYLIADESRIVRMPMLADMKVIMTAAYYGIGYQQAKARFEEQSASTQTQSIAAGHPDPQWRKGLSAYAKAQNALADTAPTVVAVA